MQELLKFENVSKNFGQKKTLNSVNFPIEQGEILGLLGPNGAGKSTLMKIATGLLEPDFGKVYFHENDIRNDRFGAKRKIAIVPQEHAFYSELSVMENISYFASQIGVSSMKATQAVNDFNLGPFVNKKAEELSGGYKRMLNIAISMLQTPELLFLDEPSVALDPIIRNDLWDKILEIQKNGTTICISTHYMEEASALCDRVCLINEGKIVALDTPENLIKNFTKPQIGMFTLKEVPTPEIVSDIRKKIQNSEVTTNGTTVIIKYPEKNLAQHEKARLLIESSGAIMLKSRTRDADLEQAFVNLTGKELK